MALLFVYAVEKWMEDRNNKKIFPVISHYNDKLYM